VAYQPCFVVSSSMQAGWTASLGGGGGAGAAPLSGSAGLVAQFSTADYIEDLRGPFFNLGGSLGIGGGVQGSGFWGHGRWGQDIWGFTFGITLTTPQISGYGIGTGTTVEPLLGSLAPSCKSRVLQ